MVTAPAILLILSLLSPTLSQEDTTIIAEFCPQNTFTCDDGSCIPVDWVGDGEPDCDDHSDEKGTVTRPRPNTTAVDSPLDGVIEEESPVLAPSAHPLHKGAKTSVATPQTPTTAAPEGTEDCPPEHLNRIDECSQPIFDFMREIQKIDFNTTSILADPTRLSDLSKGCNLSREYEICIDGASKLCQPEPSVPGWKSSETFICQLLLPSVREYSSCLGGGRSPRCSIVVDRSYSSLCHLVGSLGADIQCIKQLPGNCTEDALALVDPIREEAHHVAADLGCQLPVIEIINEKDVTTTTTTTAAPTTEEEEPIEEEVVEEEESSTTMSTTTTGEPTTTTGATGSSSPQPMQPIPSRHTVRFIRPNTTTTPFTTTTADPALTETERPKDPNAVGPRPPLGDAVRSMQFVDRMCETDYGDSPWNVVHSLLCRAAPTLSKHAQCFVKTIAKSPCSAQLRVSSVCEALEAFNSHLDCSLPVMNDECEIEAQNVVVEIQEKANDALIEHKCFVEKKEENKKKVDAEGEFSLHPSLPICSDEQENGALACLVELVEINKQLSAFQDLNFLLELSKENSSVVGNVCGQFEKYETCLSSSVFSLNGGRRCSFSSPLNTLARISLTPICSRDIRPLLSKHTECLGRLTTGSGCQSSLLQLGRSVQMMMQGFQGEALLCKAFYQIRETFECGENAVEKECDAGSVADLRKVKDQMTALGTEEGCPPVPPPNFEEILARRIARPAPVVNRPLPSLPPLLAPRTQPTPHPNCDARQQKQFQECVSPLTAYQPHPLTVIRQPRLIDEACQKFKEFQKCSSNIACRPIWSRGMTAMFEFACEESLEEFKEVRQCLRRTAESEVVRQCVGNFSRGAPTQACLSANSLLSCALSHISAECGQNATSFTIDYVTKFATAIDSRCKVASQIPIGRVFGVGCSIEEDAIVEHCAAPLNDIGNRLDEMFQGGLQSLMKNANALAPIFAGGCNLTSEFRVCAAGVLAAKTPCVVSSCLVHAGEDICASPDPVKAIDDHLSCVFSQVQEPQFAKCVRSTLSTIKHFSLAAFKMMLPRFVECVQEVVHVKCGDIPIKVLRALASPDICPIVPVRVVPVAPVRVTPKMSVCTKEKQTDFDRCTAPFYSKYRMLPIALVNENGNVQELCSMVDTVDGCSLSSSICSSSEQTAIRALAHFLCSSRTTFDQHKICLHNAAQDAASCVSPIMTAGPNEKCRALQAASKCMAEQIQSKCGAAAVQFAFAAMNSYVRSYDSKCALTIPSVSLATSCDENDLVEYLTCETHIDQFSFRPISIIGDASRWPSFCEKVSSSYSPCLRSMSCPFEPVSSANIKLFNTICNETITYRDTLKYSQCLTAYTNSPSGRKCIEPYAALDLVASNSKDKICGSLSTVLSCAAAEIREKCGYESLLHVYSLYSGYVQSFDPKCVLESPADEPSSSSSPSTPAPRRRPMEITPEMETTQPSSTTQEATSTTSTPGATTTTTDANHHFRMRDSSPSSFPWLLSCVVLVLFF